MNFTEKKKRFLSSSNLWRIIIILVITFVAFGLRMQAAINGPVEYDEPVYMHAAIDYSIDFLDRNWARLIESDYNSEHPVFYKLVYGAVLAKTTRPTEYFTVPKSDPIIGLNDFQSILNLRLVSALFGSLAVCFISILNPLAGILLAIHTYAIKYSSVIYLEALPLWLSIISMIAFTKFLEGVNDKKITPFYTVCLLISAATMGMAAASKYTYGVVGIAAALYALYVVLIKNRHPRMLAPLTIWTATILIFFFLCDPVLWIDPINHLKESIRFSFNYSTKNPEVFKYNYPLWQPLLWLAQSIPSASRIYKLPPFFIAPGNYFVAIDGLFLPLALLGICKLKREAPLFFTWLMVGLAFLIIWNTKWPQYIVMILPPYCLAAALGLRLIATESVKLFQNLKAKVLAAR